MNFSKELLTMLKRRHGLRSNYMAAKLLGVSDQTVHRVDKKGTSFMDENILKLAELLELDPAETLLQFHLESSSGNLRVVWKRILEEHHLAAIRAASGSQPIQVA